MSGLVGPAEADSFRLWEADPGRLAIDAGAGWVEPVGASGSTALVRVSTTEVAAAEAVMEEIARQAAPRTVVLETDDPRAAGPVVPPLVLFNSLGRAEQRFVSAVPGQARVYSCGPTVYSYQHIGNMRTYVFADTLKRVLLWRGYDVHHVVNITDVGHLLADADQGEDKIEEASRREGRSVEEITGQYTSVFFEDLHLLDVLDPDEWPKASAYVPQMINFATLLEEHGWGYRLPEGLYFDTAKQPDYGALAGINRDAQQATGRVEEVAGKHAPSDFALWRTFTDGRQRMMQWDSPWGVGAPGWHLECSVMSISLLGHHFDIHTGGIDHRELHHVNEIAQSEAYLDDGRPWVRYWLHGEFLQLGERKISKSAGDTLRLADLASFGVHPLAFRYLLLQSHYRSQVSFTDKAAQAAHQALRRLAARAADVTLEDTTTPMTLLEALDAAASSAVLFDRILAVDAAVANDLQTPSLVASLNTWLKSPDDMDGLEWGILLRAVNSLTGLRLGALRPADFVPPVPDDLDPEWVQDRLAERDAARAAKDWGMADRMRDELTARGVRVEDTPDGTHWYVVAPAAD